MESQKSRGIVIATSNHTRDWLTECLNSLKNAPYEVFVHDNGESGGFELAAIAEGKKRFDEFVFLMDTTEIKDVSLFDKLFAMDGHVFLTDGGYHYIGKYVSANLPEIPECSTKQDAIHWELRWLPKPWGVFEPQLPFHTNVFEEKHGRLNMVCENQYIIKWKGTWA